MTFAEITNKVNEARETQKYEKTFDLVRSFTAEANKADSFTIPLTNEGPFIQDSINILYSKNSYLRNKTTGEIIKYFCAVKLKFKSQAAGNSQSSDYIPVQLIATPGAEDMPRYGARKFHYFYPKGDALIIDYDNREPEYNPDEENFEYVMQAEQIDIAFNGHVYPLND